MKTGLAAPYQLSPHSSPNKRGKRTRQGGKNKKSGRKERCVRQVVKARGSGEMNNSTSRGKGKKGIGETWNIIERER